MQHTASGYVATSFRTLPRFRAHRVSTVAEAVNAIAMAERPAILAGGTDLPASFNEGFQPTDVIDISRVAELQQIARDGDRLSIGAAVTHAVGASDALISQSIPGFAQAWARIANVRIRLSATIGGNLMARRTRYEGAILLSALDATLCFATAAGRVDCPVAAIWTDSLPSGLLTHICVPTRPGLRLDYDRTLRPILTQALALDAGGNGHIVTATEHVAPRVAVVAARQPQSPFSTARFGDPVTSDVYINRVAGVLASRQFERLTKSAA